MLETTSERAISEIAEKAKAASAALARVPGATRNDALRLIAREIEANAGALLAANRNDVDRAQALVASGEMSEALLRRLKLDRAKLDEIIAGLHQVTALADPLGVVTLATELDAGLQLFRITCPIGVVGVIFESRPDALVQIASLCVKSGNAVMLKGGSEAEDSNRALFEIVQQTAARSGIPAEAFALLETRADVNALLKAEGFVDLIVPRGSNALVRYIQTHTNIPVLGHAEGICHIYVDEHADLKKAADITLDAKVQYPAACNAVETLLVHQAVARDFLPACVEQLKSRKVSVRCDSRSIEECQLEGVGLATEEDWHTEYSDLMLSVKIVDSLGEAIAHINTYGSHHTDSIISEDQEACEKFFHEVDSAGVYVNASTRFADGFRYGFGAEVGISTGKLHPRGPVGLEGLVTYKYKLIGEGQTVGMYQGADARRLTHKPIMVAL